MRKLRRIRKCKRRPLRTEENGESIIHCTAVVPFRLSELECTTTVQIDKNIYNVDKNLHNVAFIIGGQLLSN